MIFKAPVHFTIVVSISIVIAISVVIWASESQISGFQNNQSRIIQSEVQAAAGDIERFLVSRRTLVEAFAIDNSNLINSLSLSPENNELIEEIASRLDRWFPENFTFTVASPQGVDLIDDIDGFVGGVCKADIKTFAAQFSPMAERMQTHIKQAQQEVFIHPQASNYHFDIMAPWKIENELNGIFFVSFFPHSIQRILKNYQINDHNLVVIHRDRVGLIEISPLGTRDKITESRDISLTAVEQKLIMHKRSIPGSKWVVVGFPNPGLFEGHASATRWRAYSVMAVLCTLWVGAIFYASKQEKSRLAAISTAQQANSNLEAAVLELTSSRQELDKQAMELEAHLKDAELHRIRLEEKAVEQVDLLEKLAEARDKAESGTKAKSSFLSTMSHEIRTPLNGVLGLAQLLKDTKLDEEQTEKVNTILSSGQTLLAIINDVLDISKIEAGSLELEDKAFSLMELVSSVATPFQSLADEKKLKLDSRFNFDPDMVIKGDPVRLRQILWNLMSNAIKFTEQGRVVLVTEIITDVETIRREISTPKDHVIYFGVEDTGAGIAPDRVDAIFDAFTQEDSTITRKHGGTGLGLSIVRQLVELMGGTIRANSTLDQGTTFMAFIPFEAAYKEEMETQSLKSSKPETQQTVSLNILLAEDNEVNALIAKAFLDKFGHAVKHVENGKLAVEAAQEGWADLILMDIHMPEMNGIDATKTIRATDIGKNTPIIGLTAEAFTERLAEFREAGMVDVLTKPFTEQQLADTLASIRPNGMWRKHPDETKDTADEPAGKTPDDQTPIT